VEGEGVKHQLELADWPSPEAHLGVHAESVELRDIRDDLIYGPVSFSVAPGELAFIEGADARARTALALAVAGRMRISGGRLKSGGYVVPQQLMLMRPSIAVAQVGEAADPVSAVRLAPAQRTRVLVVVGVDFIHDLTTRAEVIGEARRQVTERGLAGLVCVSAETLNQVVTLTPSDGRVDLTPSPLRTVSAHSGRLDVS
jgi:RND superfamily putative drug exporter